MARRLKQGQQATEVLTGRTVALTLDLPPDFALNQPLAPFALAALDLLDPDSPTHALDVVSTIEAVLEAPFAILMAQQHAARGEAVAEMKADGIEYEERMRLLDEITWPRPLAEELTAAFETYRQTHPWLPEEALVPKSVVRLMWEEGMSFADFVRRFTLAPREGLVLRYLTDAYRTLTRTVPESYSSPELAQIVEWLGETVRQTDSSLLDEWEALSDPDAAARLAEGREAAAPPRPLTARTGPFRTMVRGALWQRVERAARDDLTALAAIEQAAAELADDDRSPVMRYDDWDVALGDYWEEHDRIGTDQDARGPHHLHIAEVRGPAPGLDPDVAPDARLWEVRQTLADPEGDGDWVIEATVDLDASDRVGEAVVLATALRRL